VGDIQFAKRNGRLARQRPYAFDHCRIDEPVLQAAEEQHAAACDLLDNAA
jgi:hypothetical protein